MSLLPHCSVVVAGGAQDTGVMLKYDTRSGWSQAAQCTHVTHFCTVANMINIANTGMRLTSTVDWLTAAISLPHGTGMGPSLYACIQLESQSLLFMWTSDHPTRGVCLLQATVNTYWHVICIYCMPVKCITV